MAGQQIAIIHFFFFFFYCPQFGNPFKTVILSKAIKQKLKQKKKNHNCKRVWNKTNLYKVKVCYL